VVGSKQFTLIFPPQSLLYLYLLCACNKYCSLCLWFTLASERLLFGHWDLYSSGNHIFTDSPVSDSASSETRHYTSEWQGKTQWTECKIQTRNCTF